MKHLLTLLLIFSTIVSYAQEASKANPRTILQTEGQGKILLSENYSGGIRYNHHDLDSILTLYVVDTSAIRLIDTSTNATEKIFTFLRPTGGLFNLSVPRNVSNIFAVDGGNHVSITSTSEILSQIMLTGVNGISVNYLGSDGIEFEYTGDTTKVIDSNTQVSSAEVVGDNLTFTIKNIKTNSTLSTFSIPLSEINLWTDNTSYISRNGEVRIDNRFQFSLGAMNWGAGYSIGQLKNTSNYAQIGGQIGIGVDLLANNGVVARFNPVGDLFLLKYSEGYPYINSNKKVVSKESIPVSDIVGLEEYESLWDQGTFGIHRTSNVGVLTTAKDDVSLYVSSGGNSTTLNLRDRFEFSSSGFMEWGSNRDAGIISYATGRAIIGGQANNDLALFADVSEKIRVKTDGKVGILTTAPESLLQVGKGGTPISDAFITFGKRVNSAESNLPFIGHDSPDGIGSDLGVGTRSSTGTINFYAGGTSLRFNPANLRFSMRSNGDLYSEKYVNGYWKSVNNVVSTVNKIPASDIDGLSFPDSIWFLNNSGLRANFLHQVVIGYLNQNTQTSAALTVDANDQDPYFSINATSSEDLAGIKFTPDSYPSSVAPYVAGRIDGDLVLKPGPLPNAEVTIGGSNNIITSIYKTKVAQNLEVTDGTIYSSSKTIVHNTNNVISLTSVDARTNHTIAIAPQSSGLLLPGINILNGSTQEIAEGREFTLLNIHVSNSLTVLANSSLAPLGAKFAAGNNFTLEPGQCITVRYHGGKWFTSKR